MSRHQVVSRVLCRVAALVVALSALGSAAAESHDESVLAWFKNVYAAGFIEGDPNFLDHYAEPMQFVIGKEIQTLDREALGIVVDEIYVQPWVEAGWKTTALIEAQAERLGPDSARVTASWALLDEAGKNVAGCERPEWHYILVNNGERWQVIAEIEGGCP